MSQTRIDRNKDFDKFYNNAKETFTALQMADPSCEKFQLENMLCICPGSRAGGTDKRVVEVFWGKKIFEIETNGGNNWKGLIETGATLLFHRDDNGFVIITIFPAYTDNRRPVESSITLNIWLDPKRLSDKHFIKSLWEKFMAYMELTSLDGYPTFRQRLIVWYLRTFKHYVVANIWMPSKFSEFCKDVLKWTVTVGLSGLIVYFVSKYSQGNTKEPTILEQINKSLNKISTLLEKIEKNNLQQQAVSNKVDSIP